MKLQNQLNAYKKDINSQKSKAPTKPGNDPYYWEHVFLAQYKDMKFHRRWNKEHTRCICTEGDIKTMESDPNKCTCVCGNSSFKGRMWGSLDAGYDIVYNCSKCGQKMLKAIRLQDRRIIKMKYLFLVCGCPGSGKSTWIRQQLSEIKYKAKWISRDTIRYLMVNENEEYFSKETAVFDEFINEIQYALGTNDVVFADATHLTEKSRNKTLDRLNLDGITVYAVNFNLPLDTCLSQNENRKGTRAYVPRSVVRRMHSQYVAPHEGEKYDYEGILTVGLPYGEEY